LALLLFGCGSDDRTIDASAIEPVAAKPALGLEHFAHLKQIDELFVEQNYELKRKTGRSPAIQAMADEFNAFGVTAMGYRSVHPVPQMDANTFYRFTLFIESFQTSADAERRLARLYDRPPRDPDQEPDKAFPLRRGFAVGSLVYILATDVNAFTPELDRLTKVLEPKFAKGFVSIFRPPRRALHNKGTKPGGIHGRRLPSLDFGLGPVRRQVRRETKAAPERLGPRPRYVRTNTPDRGETAGTLEKNNCGRRRRSPPGSDIGVGVFGRRCRRRPEQSEVSKFFDQASRTSKTPRQAVT
jgi:hypothetical protein